MVKTKNYFVSTNYLKIALIFCAIFFVFNLFSCTNNTEIPSVKVTINDGGNTINVTPEIGTTVQSILASQNIVLSQFDKVTPDLFSVITESTDILIVRVEEKFDTEEIVIPYDQQTVRNESLPEKQTILVQTGKNGTREITYRNLFENGILISRSIIRQVDTILPKPEIIMVGVQSPFAPIPFNGKVIYISAGNAWMMESDSANRRPLITTGDLDGRIFSLSKNLDWLLFSRNSDDPNVINELWVINLSKKDAEPVYLKIDNVIHFAEWLPGYALSVLVSTVEKRQVAPGWQANNNLIQLTLGADGKTLKQEEIIESNSGGIYGWWGTTFQFSPNGEILSFARPDSIGYVDFENNELIVLHDIIPFQTGSEWAWVTPISWSSDSKFIYFVEHQSDPSFSNPESSPFFDLKSINIETNQILSNRKNVGMFSFTSSSPLLEKNKYKIIYLQAVFPENSDTSRYRVMIVDRDGSNSYVIFPSEGNQGIEPQSISWEPCIDKTLCQAGILYQGNIWLLDTIQNASVQLTGDGLITRFSWN